VLIKNGSLRRERTEESPQDQSTNRRASLVPSSLKITPREISAIETIEISKLAKKRKSISTNHLPNRNANKSISAIKYNNFNSFSSYDIFQNEINNNIKRQIVS